MFCIYSEEARGEAGPSPGGRSAPGPRSLETAKEILAEVFHARPGEVEEMIQRRLEKRSWDQL
ncbi:MAG: hypothetical protein ACYDHX_17605 [Methanothrix sp.]